MEYELLELINAVEILGKPTWFDYVSILISLLAVGIAVYIPVRVANEQNKIALFDKRVEVYMQLNNYFDSPQRWPRAIMQQLGGLRGIPKEKVFDETTKQLFTLASFLFSSQVGEQLTVIKKNYSEIRFLDSCLEEGFTFWGEDDLKRLLELLEHYQLDRISEDELKELVTLSQEHEFLHVEQVSESIIERTPCDIVSLLKRQDELYITTRNLQNKVRQQIEQEIKFSKK